MLPASLQTSYVFVKQKHMNGYGKKVKYVDQEYFIIKAVVTGLGTGNTIRNTYSYGCLVYRLGHKCGD